MVALHASTTSPTSAATTALAALDEVAGYRFTDATRIADIASVRARFGERAAVLVETTLLRRKAVAKFADPDGWLFTDEALQQATAAPGCPPSGASARRRRRARRHLFDRRRACGASGYGSLRRRQRPRPGAACDGPPQRGSGVDALPRRRAARPSPVTPSSSPIPPAEVAAVGASTRATTRRRSIGCSRCTQSGTWS